MALPELGVPAIKVKIDSGARTSALHAFDIEPYEQNGERRVRFKTHPIQGPVDIVRDCDCLLVDERIVASSNGQREKRYVIKTLIERDSIKAAIEITLTSRLDMEFRMLLGRTAMRDMNVLVDPNQSFLLGRISKPKDLYKIVQGVLHKIGTLLSPDKFA